MFEPSNLSEAEARERWNDYIESYCQWAEEWESAMLRNRQIVENWQAEQDKPYPVYRLKYAVAPADWSYMGKIERASIWSLTPQPNEQGYWTVIERGRAIERHYRIWISVDIGPMVRPTDEKFGYVLFLPNAQLNVTLHPNQRYTAKELEHELALTPLPDEPQAPREIYERLFPDLVDDFMTLPVDLAQHELDRRREAQGLEGFDREFYGVRNRTHESWEGLEEDDEE